MLLETQGYFWDKCYKNCWSSFMNKFNITFEYFDQKGVDFKNFSKNLLWHLYIGLVNMFFGNLVEIDPVVLSLELHLYRHTYIPKIFKKHRFELRVHKNGYCHWIRFCTTNNNNNMLIVWEKVKVHWYCKHGWVQR